MDVVQHLPTPQGLQSLPRGFLGDWPRHRWAWSLWLQLRGIGVHFGPDATTFVATQPEAEVMKRVRLSIVMGVPPNGWLCPGKSYEI